MTVGGGAGGVVGVNSDDLPISRLGGDERAQLGFLGFEAERLVVLVGGAADVDRDAACGVLGDLLDQAFIADFSGHGDHSKIICFW